MREVGRLKQLRSDLFAVVCGVRRIVSDRTVLISEFDKARVLYAIPLIGGNREDRTLRELMCFREPDFVV